MQPLPLDILPHLAHCRTVSAVWKGIIQHKREFGRARSRWRPYAMVIKWDEIMPAGQIERRASHKILAQIGMARACKTNNG